ncbi:hypothetical protein HK104_002003 [Borealophlyctis nickersoniae]|nr:hypothetical protein HK104_002003 [Borealophlyctis nickersoniae]
MPTINSIPDNDLADFKTMTLPISTNDLAGFQSLPTELVQKIVVHSTIPAGGRLRSTCRWLSQIITSEDLTSLYLALLEQLECLIAATPLPARRHPFLHPRDHHDPIKNARQKAFAGAVCKGHLPLVIAFLNHDDYCSLITPDSRNWNPLVDATRNNHIEVIHALLDAGADGVQTALEEAVMAGRIEIVELLIGRVSPKAGPTEQTTEKGGAYVNTSPAKSTGAHMCLLQKAVGNGADMVLIEMLIRHGVPTRGAVSLAARRGELEIVKLLVEKGGGDPQQGLYGACCRSDKEMIAYLLGKGARAESAHYLVEAVTRGNAEIVELLVRHGASRGTAGENIVRMAVKLGREDIVRILSSQNPE